MTLKRAFAIGCLFGVAALLAQRVLFYFPFLSDDALISLRYAQRLLDGQGLTWTDGERVEGYTDLAWVLLTAGLGALRVDLIVAARALGVLGAGLALAFSSFRPSRPADLSVARVLSGGLFLALSDPLAVWAVGGLEQGLQAGVTVAAAWLLMRGARSGLTRADRGALAGLFILIVWLRADGALLVACLLAGNAVRALLLREAPGKTVKENVVLGLPPLVAVLAQLVFRRAYYGAWVPNTALVKVGLSLARLELGLTHLGAWAEGAWPLLLAGVLGLVALRKETNRVWLIPLAASVGWFAYLATMGGDIFPGWRQVLIGLAPLGLIIAEGAEAWWDSARARGAVGVIGAVLLLSYARAQRIDPENLRAKTERWEFEGASLGPALKEAWGSLKPLMAVDAAGTLPYFSGLPSLDLLGLTDRYIATHPPDLTGRLSTGHELGDGAYAWRRKPDLLAFCGGMGGRNPCFLGGRQLVAQPAFGQTYQLMRYHTAGPPELRGELWVRREDSVLGVERAAGFIKVPGWLVAERTGVTALHEGRFQARVSAVEPGWLQNLAVPAGRWRVRVSPERAWTVGALCDGQSAPRTTAGALVLEVADGARVDLQVGTTQGEAFVSEVLLERTEAPSTQDCAGGALEYSAEALSTVVPDGAHFLQPEGVLLHTGSVLRVRLPTGHRGCFELSLDGNDGYGFRALRGEEVLAAGQLASVPHGGLFARLVEVPVGADVLELTVQSGDGLSGLGHVRAVE